jgi:hypothetical protein
MTVPEASNNENPMSEPRTVTVRIPLMIDANGRWASVGTDSTGVDDDDIFDWADPGEILDWKTERKHWITAEVPVPAPAPAPTEIAGRAEPAEG